MHQNKRRSGKGYIKAKDYCSAKNRGRADLTGVLQNAADVRT